MSNELIERIDKAESLITHTISMKPTFGVQMLFDKRKLLEDCKSEIERLLLANETLKELNVEYLERVKALEAKPVGEPVAWYARDNLEVRYDIEVIWSSQKPTYAEVWIPLYTLPPNIDALIAEIDEMVGNEHVVYCDQLITALDKWRTK